MSNQSMTSIAEYINEIVIAGSGVAASLVAWKQGQKTAKTSHLDNVEKAIKIWEDTSTKLSDKLTVVESEMVTFKQNHEECEKSKKELEEKVKCLDGQVCEMKEALHNVIGTPKNIRK